MAFGIDKSVSETTTEEKKTPFFTERYSKLYGQYETPAGTENVRQYINYSSNKNDLGNKNIQVRPRPQTQQLLEQGKQQVKIASKNLSDFMKNYFPQRKSNELTPINSDVNENDLGLFYKPEQQTGGVPIEETISKNAGNIVGAAQKYLGTPYVWGGESMQEGGMDCSGFVYNVLKDSGYNVGRTTAQGYRSQGTVVPKSEMQPGDLIFFGSGNDASHIGVYIGNGQMIHSSGGSKNTKSNPGKGVSVANVDYRSDFIEARRY